MESADDNNNIKWAAIPLTIPLICKTLLKEQLNDWLFNN